MRQARMGFAMCHTTPIHSCCRHRHARCASNLQETRVSQEEGRPFRLQCALKSPVWQNADIAATATLQRFCFETNARRLTQ